MGASGPGGSVGPGACPWLAAAGRNGGVPRRAHTDRQRCTCVWCAGRTDERSPGARCARTARAAHDPAAGVAATGPCPDADRPPYIRVSAVRPLLTSHHATARPGDDVAPGTSRADTPVCGPRFLLISGLLEASKRPLIRRLCGCCGAVCDRSRPARASPFRARPHGAVPRQGRYVGGCDTRWPRPA